MKILLTGSSGLVGSHLLEYISKLDQKNLRLLCPTSTELDITNSTSVSDYFLRNKPEIVVHFAGFTDVTAAENQRGDKQGLAWKINVLGMQNIADNCLINKTYLISISTDMVFSGKNDNPGPYKEDAPPETDFDKVSWYGATKIQAENYVTATMKNYAIVRISNPTRARFDRKLDYVRKILYLYDNKKLHPLFCDQHLTLTYINEVSAVVYKLIADKKTGIFHVSSCDLFTPFELGQYLFYKIRGVKNVVQKASLTDYLKSIGSSPRYMQFSGLDTSYTKKELGLTFLGWREIIDALIKEDLH